MTIHNGSNFMENTGAELRIPPIGNIFDPDIFLYIIFYFVAFQLLAIFVKRCAWQSAVGFRRYRLHNLSVCFVHSFVSAAWSLGFFLLNSDLMLYHTLHWYKHSARHLLLFSTGYFMHDSVDMLKNEWSRWTVELLFHHFACVFVFFCALLPRKFLLYAYWALLMEVNSVFLHIRTISQLNALPNSHLKLFRIFQIANLATFVLFRFGVQAWQVAWIWAQRHHIHYFYVCVGFYGGLFFFALNVCLFMRLLAADKLFKVESASAKQFYAMNRDEQTMQSTNSKNGMLAIDEKKENMPKNE